MPAITNTESKNSQDHQAEQPNNKPHHQPRPQTDFIAGPILPTLVETLSRGSLQPAVVDLPGLGPQLGWAGL